MAIGVTLSSYVTGLKGEIAALRTQLSEREAYIVVLERQREEASKAMDIGSKFERDAIAKIRELRAKLADLRDGESFVLNKVQLAEHKIDQYLQGQTQTLRLGVALEACRAVLLRLAVMAHI